MTYNEKYYDNINSLTEHENEYDFSVGVIV